MIVLELRNMPEDHEAINVKMQEIISTMYAYYKDEDGRFFAAIDTEIKYPDDIGIEELHGHRAKHILHKIESTPQPED